MNFLRLLACSFLLSAPIASRATMATVARPVANATNEFGLDLYRKLATGDENLCLSPYSIETALVMTFAGAEGETRTEMARVLHLPPNTIEVHGLFAALQKSLEEMVAKSGDNVAQSKKFGGSSEPITLAIANRLFAQKDFNFRASFLALAKDNYRAPMEPLDFAHNANRATKTINDWIAEQTHTKNSRFDSDGRAR